MAKTNKNFKDLSIRWKLGALLLTLAVLAVGNTLMINYFQDQRRTEGAIIDAAGRNRMLSQKIGFLAEKIGRGHSDDKHELQEVITLHNTSLMALKLGGVIPGIADNQLLPASKPNIIPTLTEAETLWEKYQHSAEVVVKEPTYIDTIKSVATLDTSLNFAPVQQTVRILNPKIESAITSIEDMAEDMLRKNNALVKRYVEESAKNQAQMDNILILVLAFNLFVLGIFMFIITKFVLKPISNIKNFSTRLAEGDLTQTEEVEYHDELGSAVDNLNLLTGHLNEAALFAENIGNGVFESDFEVGGEQDALGQALLEMRGRLINVAKEDKKRNWAAEGLAKFATLLQQDYDSLEALSFEVISSLINYMSANQGALFLTNDNQSNPAMELSAMYAWGKKKYIKNEISLGEGILGQAWQEQSLVYLTEVPEDYVQITSGIGKANPRSVIIIPLQLNEEVYGMIEMASFKEYDEYELDFVQKVAERIAATISTARINHRTRYLLEQSQQQAEELRAQEEEMRQNMEELSATQEEMERNQLEMSGQLTAIDTCSAYIEFNLQGEILKANNHFLNATKYFDIELIKGKHHRIFMDPEEANTPEYHEFWAQLRKGVSQHGEFKRVAKDGSEIWLLAYYTPVLNKYGEPIKIIKLATDITQQKLDAIEANGKLEAIGKSSAVIEFDINGKILTANDLFLDLMEYELSEIQGKHHSIFVSEEERQSDEYRAFWGKLSRGEFVVGEFKRYNKSGEAIWIKGSYNAILDLNGNPVRVVKYAQDITHEKHLALESQEFTEKLASQEEELRQNLEELQATQDQIYHQMKEGEKLKEAMSIREKVLSHTTILSESDPYGTILFVNDKLCEVSKYTSEELIGQPHNIFRHPDMPKELFKEMWQNIKQGKSFSGIIKNKRKDGGHYWVDATIVPIKNKEGEIVKYVGARYHIQDDSIAEELFAKQLEELNIKTKAEIKK